MREGLSLASWWLALFILEALSGAEGCNYMKFRAGDGTAIVARDMQFSLTQAKFITLLKTHPKGERFTPTGTGVFALPGALASWTVSHGYLSFDLFGLGGSDGLNTAGLQCSMLYLPGYAEYQVPPAGAGNITIPQYTFCDWVLGLHSTVKEVNASVPNVYVAGVELPDFGVSPVHYAVTDTSGAGIVVEYTQGGTRAIYDNSVGVMTNSPPYDWQLLNLGLYAPTMSPLNPSPVTYGNIQFDPTGNWGSMLGLQANANGASRFVKLAVQLHFAADPRLIPTAEKAINLASHMVNIGDQINGTTVAFNTKIADGTTQVQYEGDTSLWSVLYNLNSQTFYFRSYNNFVWQFVDMKQLNFSAGATPVYLNAYAPTPAPDVTSSFKSS